MVGGGHPLVAQEDEQGVALVSQVGQELAVGLVAGPAGQELVGPSLQGSERLVQLAAADLAGVSAFPQGDDDPSGGFNQYSPGISVAPDGRIDVAWPDFRNDPFSAPALPVTWGRRPTSGSWTSTTPRPPTAATAGRPTPGSPTRPSTATSG